MRDTFVLSRFLRKGTRLSRLCAIVAYAIESMRERFDNESRALIARLEKALFEVEAFEGLLPICAASRQPDGSPRRVILQSS
jgi:hypothetical protein